MYIHNSHICITFESTNNTNNMTSIKTLAPNCTIVNDGSTTTLFSYDTAIVRKFKDGKISLDSKFWDYSKTTSKHRNLFLNESKKETEQKRSSGAYSLENLN